MLHAAFIYLPPPSNDSVKRFHALESFPFNHINLLHTRPSMDLNILSAESYSQTPFDAANVTQSHNDGDQWAEEILPNRSQARGYTKQRNPPAAARPRQPSKKESRKSTSTDEGNGTRQRGRPRLDTRDQTAAEVQCSESAQRYLL